MLLFCLVESAWPPAVLCCRAQVACLTLGPRQGCGRPGRPPGFGTVCGWLSGCRVGGCTHVTRLLCCDSDRCTTAGLPHLLKAGHQRARRHLPKAHQVSGCKWAAQQVYACASCHQLSCMILSTARHRFVEACECVATKYWKGAAKSINPTINQSIKQ